MKRALISVYDKTGIVDFARALVDEFGIEIVSTGGTASLLEENHIPVTLVEEVTGFPEMMDGRVKTLHPKIHAAILADRDNPEHMRQLEEQGIEPIDMVVVSLYPFRETVRDPDCTFEQAIEMIDIGGPCLLRAAAKNHEYVLPISEQWQYAWCLDYLRGNDPPWGRSRFREGLAISALACTWGYDMQIAAWLDNAVRDSEEPGWRERAMLSLLEGRKRGMISQFWRKSESLRYGENPHQRAAFLLEDEARAGCLGSKKVVAGGEMSFNNYADASAALGLCHELVRASSPGRFHAVFVKHTNACGVGSADSALETYRRAYLGDPNAAMGGVLACDFEIDPAFATVVMETYDRWGKDTGAGGFFIEVWVAPSFADPAIEIIKSKKKWGRRVRLVAVGDLSQVPDDREALFYKQITGGSLVQNHDLIGLNESDWKVVTKRSPTDSEMADLRLAWLVCKHTKSNAITICKDNMLVGNGAGQASRVMSCRIATWLAKENGHAEKLAGAAAASDAFFPFRDGPDILIDAGVTAIIQPGGSKRDADTIAACNERGVAMVFTGTRHFRH